jgi:hypothetical protein
MGKSIFWNPNLNDLTAVFEEILQVYLLEMVREIADKQSILRYEPQSLFEGLDIEVLLLVEVL